jgi:hypothetical protein
LGAGDLPSGADRTYLVRRSQFFVAEKLLLNQRPEPFP